MLTDDVAVLSFPLATSEILNKNGGKTEITEWQNIVMSRGLAESAFKLLKKGSLVYQEGKIHTRSFTDKTGLKKYTTEIVAEQFALLGRSSDFYFKGITFEAINYIVLKLLWHCEDRNL